MCARFVLNDVARRFGAVFTFCPCPMAFSSFLFLTIIDALSFGETQLCVPYMLCAHTQYSRTRAAFQARVACGSVFRRLFSHPRSPGSNPSGVNCNFFTFYFLNFFCSNGRIDAFRSVDFLVSSAILCLFIPLFAAPRNFHEKR